jgi:inosose dehydratase
MTDTVNSTIRLATGPCTWGVDFADAPGNPPWQRVLDDIAESGIGALELGPVGYLPEDPDVLRSELGRRSLTSVGSFIFDDLHDPASHEHLVAQTERVCRAIAASGGTVFVIIDRPDEVRVATAGRPGAALRLDGAGWAAMMREVEALAAIARSYGLRPVVHPHAGGYLEFEDEIERLVADTDLDLCLDTGHLAYARMDAAEMIRRHGARLGHLHFKDIRPDVLARTDAEALTFWQAIEAGIFCPMGEGVVVLDDVLDALEEVGYAGFATIEQDRVPGSGAALDDLRRSMAVIDAARSRRG